MPVHSAMAKYENINGGYTFEILEECSKDKLNERERYWIQKLHSDIFENGYNIASGGQDGFALSRERHSQAILTEKQVNEIKDKIAKREQTFRAIAEEYNVSPGTITLINKGVNWHDSNRKYPIIENVMNDEISLATRKKNMIFTRQEIQKIRSLRNEGHTYSFIREYFNNKCSLSLISQICLNKIYN